MVSRIDPESPVGASNGPGFYVNGQKRCNAVLGVPGSCSQTAHLTTESEVEHTIESCEPCVMWCVSNGPNVVPDGPKVRKTRLCSLRKVLNGVDSEFWLADNACSVACVFSVLSVRKGRWYRE